MNKKNNILYLIFVIISIIILLIILLYINLKALKKDNNIISEYTTITQTTNNTTSEIKKVIKNIDSQEISMELTTYTSILGIKIDYDINRFVPVKMTNSIRFNKIDNPDIYIEIFKINKNEYINESSNLIDNIKIKYFNLNENYYKIEIHESIDDNITNLVMNYMVTTILVS